jgi:hypothetical protein
VHECHASGFSEIEEAAIITGFPVVEAHDSRLISNSKIELNQRLSFAI